MPLSSTSARFLTPSLSFFGLSPPGFHIAKAKLFFGLPHGLPQRARSLQRIPQPARLAVAGFALECRWLENQGP